MGAAMVALICHGVISMLKILFLLLVISTPSWGLTMDDLIEREGLYYKKNSPTLL